jgi:hypothetical protein
VCVCVCVCVWGGGGGYDRIDEKCYKTFVGNHARKKPINIKLDGFICRYSKNTILFPIVGLCEHGDSTSHYIKIKYT